MFFIVGDSFLAGPLFYLTYLFCLVKNISYICIMEKIKKVQLNLDNTSMANVREYLGGSFNGFFSLPQSKICTMVDTLNGVITAYDTDFISKDEENNFIIINKTK